MAQKSQPMEFLAGKRGATMAPSAEKPTATTASSAHCSKTGAPGSATRLQTSRNSPSAARARETAHMYQASQAASLELIPAASYCKMDNRLAFDEKVSVVVCDASFISIPYPLYLSKVDSKNQDIGRKTT